MEDEFAELDIKTVTNQAIDEITPDEIRLAGGGTLPFKLAMLAPPFKGVAGVAPLGEKLQPGPTTSLNRPRGGLLRNLWSQAEGR